MNDILVYLATNYPTSESRAAITHLDLANKNLAGELDFTNLGFTNLKKLEVQNNQLTKLVINNPFQLTYLDCSNNQIKDLQFQGVFVESSLSGYQFFEFLNNPLSTDYQKKILLAR